MISSAVIVCLFGVLVVWSVLTGNRHWTNKDEVRRRVQELGGVMPVAIPKLLKDTRDGEERGS